MATSMLASALPWIRSYSATVMLLLKNSSTRAVSLVIMSPWNELLPSPEYLRRRGRTRVGRTKGGTPHFLADNPLAFLSRGKGRNLVGRWNLGTLLDNCLLVFAGRRRRRRLSSPACLNSWLRRWGRGRCLLPRRRSLLLGGRRRHLLAGGGSNSLLPPSPVSCPLLEGSLHK